MNGLHTRRDGFARCFSAVAVHLDRTKGKLRNKERRNEGRRKAGVVHTVFGSQEQAPRGSMRKPVGCAKEVPVWWVCATGAGMWEMEV